MTYDEDSFSFILSQIPNTWVHVSTVDNLTTLEPRTPQTAYEPDTARICTAPTLTKCLKGRYTDKGETLHVYIIDIDKPCYKPTVAQVIDVNETNEHWILNPVKCQKIGTVKTTKIHKTSASW